MTLRADKKQQSRDRILEAAGRRLRTEGLSGAGIASVMSDAGLTHGAFYAHFSDKDALARAALVHALFDNRKRWIDGASQEESWSDRLWRLAERYLTPVHRDNLDDSCALAAIASETARSDDSLRGVYEHELLKTLSAISGDDFTQLDNDRADETLAFMALLIGALTLSRAVRSGPLADQLLKAARNAAKKLINKET